MKILLHQEMFFLPLCLFIYLCVCVRAREYERKNIKITCALSSNIFYAFRTFWAHKLKQMILNSRGCSRFVFAAYDKILCDLYMRKNLLHSTSVTCICRKKVNHRVCVIDFGRNITFLHRI